QDRRGQNPINQRDPTLGPQQGVIQRPAGTGLGGGQHEQGRGRRRCPDDAKHRVLRTVPRGQYHRGLRQEVHRQGRESIPDQPQPRRWRSSPVPASSQITMVDAPISISESRPNPASATDRAAAAAIARITIPATFQPSVTYSSAKPRRSRVPRTGSSAGTTVHILAEAAGPYPDCSLRT